MAKINAATSTDRDWIRSFIRQRWSDEVVVAHGTVYRPHQLEGWIARSAQNRKIGLETIHIQDQDLEIVTLDSTDVCRGIGTRLVQRAIDHAQQLGLDRVWMITTNDNVNAISFYLRRGFRLVEVHLDALEISRRLKPAIPLVGEHGIPIRDELEFEYKLEPSP